MYHRRYSIVHLSKSILYITLQPSHGSLNQHFSSESSLHGSTAWSNEEINALLKATEKYKPKSINYQSHWHNILYDRDLNLVLHNRIKSCKNPLKLLSNKYKSLYQKNKLIQKQCETPVVPTSHQSRKHIRHRSNQSAQLQPNQLYRVNQLCQQLNAVYMNDNTTILQLIDEIRTVSQDKLDKPHWLIMFRSLIKTKQYDTSYVLLQYCCKRLPLPKYIIYTDYMKLCIQYELYDTVLQLYNELKQSADNIIDMTMYNVILQCYKDNSNNAIRLMNDITSNGTIPDPKLYSTLLTIIQHDTKQVTEEQQIQRTVTVLQSMQKFYTKLNADQYTVLIHIFGKHLNHEQSRNTVLQLYESMRCAGMKVSINTYNIIMRVYMYIGDLHGTQHIFDYCNSIGLQPDRYMYHQLLSQYVKYHQSLHIHHLINHMLSNNVSLDHVTYNILLQYCTRHRNGIILALHVYNEMCDRHIKPDIVSYRYLIDVFDHVSRTSDPLIHQSIYNTQSIHHYITTVIRDQPILYTYKSIEYPCATAIEYGVCKHEVYCNYSHDLLHNTHASAITSAKQRLGKLLNNHELIVSNSTLYISDIPLDVTREQIMKYFVQFDSSISVTHHTRHQHKQQCRINFTSIDSYNLCLYDNIYRDNVPRIHTISDRVITVLPYTYSIYRHSDHVINEHDWLSLQNKSNELCGVLWDTIWYNKNMLLVKYNSNTGILKLPIIHTNNSYTLSIVQSHIWLTVRYIQHTAQQHRYQSGIRIDCIVQCNTYNNGQSMIQQFIQHINDTYSIQCVELYDAIHSNQYKYVCSLVISASQLRQRYG